MQQSLQERPQYKLHGRKTEKLYVYIRIDFSEYNTNVLDCFMSLKVMTYCT